MYAEFGVTIQGQSCLACCLSRCERSLANSFLQKICYLAFPQGDYRDHAVKAALSFLCCDLQILLAMQSLFLREAGARSAEEAGGSERWLKICSLRVGAFRTTPPSLPGRDVQRRPSGR